jgi:hypothetical protein
MSANRAILDNLCDVQAVDSERREVRREQLVWQEQAE